MTPCRWRRPRSSWPNRRAPTAAAPRWSASTPTRSSRASAMVPPRSSRCADSGRFKIVIASAAKRSRAAGRSSGRDCFVALRAPRNDSALLEDELRLGDESDEATLTGRNAGLPDHRPPAAVDRRRLCDPPGADRRWRAKIGFALDRRRARPLRQIDDRAHRAERVGECHDRAAVEHRRGGAEILTDGHLGDNSVRRGADERDAQKLGKGQLCIIHPVEQIQFAFSSLRCGLSARREALRAVFWQDRSRKQSLLCHDCQLKGRLRWLARSPGGHWCMRKLAIIALVSTLFVAGGVLAQQKAGKV